MNTEDARIPARRALTVPPRIDMALALAIGVALQAELWFEERYEGVLVFQGSRPVNAMLLALIAAAFAWRRVYPLASLAGVMIGVSLQSLLFAGSEAVGLFALILVSVFSAAAYDARWQATLAITAAGLAIHDVRDPQIVDFGDHLYAPIFALIGFGLGRVVRRRQLQAESSDRRADLLADQAARAVEDERARIAREIHDIVSHSVSVMVVQAGGAEQVIDSDPAAAKQALRMIQQAGRGAVDDLSRLLGLLRQSGDGEALEPQPGLRDVAALLERVRSAGLDVDYSETGDRPELPAGAELAVYRLLQEGLTNAIKHANAARAVLNVDFGSREVKISIADDGGGAACITDGGNGLIGLKERFAIYGGTVETESPPGGGFVLRGKLPLEGERR